MTVDMGATHTVASGIAGFDTIRPGRCVCDRIEEAPGSDTPALPLLLDGVRRGAFPADRIAMLQYLEAGGAGLTGFYGILTGTPRLADSEASARAACDG